MQEWLGNGRPSAFWYSDVSDKWGPAVVAPDPRTLGGFFGKRGPNARYALPELCSFQVYLAWRGKIRHAKCRAPQLRMYVRREFGTQAAGCFVVSKHTSIERGPSAANSVFVNTTLASSALVNRPRRRSLDDLLENKNKK